MTDARGTTRPQPDLFILRAPASHAAKTSRRRRRAMGINSRPLRGTMRVVAHPPTCDSIPRAVALASGAGGLLDFMRACSRYVPAANRASATSMSYATTRAATPACTLPGGDAQNARHVCRHARMLDRGGNGTAACCFGAHGGPGALEKHRTFARQPIVTNHLGAVTPHFSASTESGADAVLLCAHIRVPPAAGRRTRSARGLMEHGHGHRISHRGR